MRKIEGLNSLPRDPPDRLHEALLSALGCTAAHQSAEAIDGHRLFRDYRNSRSRNLAWVDFAIFAEKRGREDLEGSQVLPLTWPEACTWMNQASHLSRLWQPFLLQVLLLLLVITVTVYRVLGSSCGAHATTAACISATDSEEQTALLQTPGHDHGASDVIDDEPGKPRFSKRLSAPPARWKWQRLWLL